MYCDIVKMNFTTTEAKNKIWTWCLIVVIKLKTKMTEKDVSQIERLRNSQT